MGLNRLSDKNSVSGTKSTQNAETAFSKKSPFKTSASLQVSEPPTSQTFPTNFLNQPLQRSAMHRIGQPTPVSHQPSFSTKMNIGDNTTTDRPRLNLSETKQSKNKTLKVLDPINQQILALQRDLEDLDSRYQYYETRITRKS